ncbi:MAG TPA: methyltransferase domain-containing protein [Solirubrobacterales bacterium]|nr:methyltransferase domain-containing protein [Solirubrobacterales bacterium]
MTQDDAYFEFDRPELRELVPTEARRVLDVGCGAGALGAALREERGIEVIGLELSVDAAARARDRLDAVIEADLDHLDDLPFEHGTFDAMFFGDVLEHLRDPHRLLRILRPWLADHGALVCSIPNVAHWSVVLPLLTQDRWPYADAGLLDRTHVHIFTLTEAHLMLTECGFTVDSAAATTLPQSPPPAVDHLIRFLAALGSEKAAAGRRLTAYQYLLVARPAG